MSEGLLDDDPFAIAESKHWKVVVPEPRDVQLDYDFDVDEEEEVDQVRKRISKAQTLIDRMAGAGLVMRIEETTISPGGNRHVYIHCSSHELDPLQRIIIQLILGSDPIREMLSFLRIVTGAKRPPTLLYEIDESVETIDVDPIK